MNIVRYAILGEWPSGQLFALVLALLLCPVDAMAEVYKWVDEKGNVQYGDKPPVDKPVTTISPRGLKNQSTGQNVSKSTFQTTKSARTRIPIINKSPTITRTVELQRIYLNLEAQSAGVHVVGHDYLGSSCIQQHQTLTVPHGRREINSASLQPAFEKVLSENLYKAFKPSDDIFRIKQEQTGDLILGAVIKELQMNLCRNSNRQNMVDTKSYMRIAWQLFDPLEREIIYRGETEGSDIGKYNAGGNVEEFISRQNAFANALRNLLAEQEFVSLLSGADSSNNSFTASKTENDPIRLSLNYGNKKGSFLQQVSSLKEAIITVRSTKGHGTGFLIHADGFILTNEHVVGDSEYVMVVTDKEKIKADVVRVNKIRDVALLKLQGKISGTALTLAGTPLVSGEPVFVIGTPFDEALSHTVTKGIISATRTDEQGMRFYQTDASVHPGNSGGPAFNDAGEVIGIAVSGLINKSGSSIDINFLIPIDHALEVLQIQQ